MSILHLTVGLNILQFLPTILLQLILCNYIITNKWINPPSFQILSFTHVLKTYCLRHLHHLLRLQNYRWQCNEFFHRNFYISPNITNNVWLMSSQTKKSITILVAVRSLPADSLWLNAKNPQTFPKFAQLS